LEISYSNNENQKGVDRETSTAEYGFSSQKTHRIKSKADVVPTLKKSKDQLLTACHLTYQNYHS